MSFNVRYGTARDGDNAWDHRKEFLVETIKAFGPDLLGTQETLKSQRDFLAENLSEYDVVGVGRDDGEMMAVYYRRDRFQMLCHGHFWLSTTPEVVGSKSWDSSLPRMVTWLRLKDVKRRGKSSVLFLNTHFDHRGKDARQRSAALIRQRILEMADGRQCILTGDFNSAEGSIPYQELFAVRNGLPSPVVDSYRELHDSGQNEGTFSGFRATETHGARIDWIGVTRDWKIESAGIDHTARDGRTPSDHLPVTVIVR